jgi:predicted MFS family arabinose efflux permease
VTTGPDDRGSPSIRLLQVICFVSTLDRFAMPPMLVAIALDLGVPLSDIVNAAGAYFLVYGFMQPVWGAVSDRIGRVRTMRLTLLLAGLFSIGSAFAFDPLMLGVARALAGGFFGAAYPSTLIYLGDTVAPRVRQRDIARLMVGVALGTALASIGAGLLADVASWRAAFVITGASSVVLAMNLRLLPEPVLEHPSRSVWAPLRDIARSRVALLVLAMAFVEGMVLLGALTLLPPAVEHAGSGAAVAGAVTGVYGISVLLGSRLVGALSQRWHPAWLIGGGSIAAVAACGVLAVSRAPTAAVIGVVLLGLAWTAMHSSLQTWATEVLPLARASVVSLFAGSLFVGSALGAVLVADLAEAGRYALVYVVGALLAIPLGLVATWQRRLWQPPLAGR